MYRKKEIIIIIASILVITLFLAFLPLMLNSNDNVSEPTTTTIKPSYIDITLEGELIVPGNEMDDDSIANTITIQVPYGVTYGEIMKFIGNYFTEYSIIEDDLKKRYYDSTTIVIESSYIEEVAPDINIENKIVISTATMDELLTLYGIGEKRAQIIIEYREINSIDSFEELQSLLGVSDAIITSIKEKAVL